MKFWDSSELLVAHPCLCSKWPCTVHFKITALCYMRFASKKNKQDLWYLVTAWNSAADIFQRLRESIGLLSACILLSKCMILSEQRTSGRTCTDSARLLFLSLFFFKCTWLYSNTTEGSLCQSMSEGYSQKLYFPWIFNDASNFSRSLSEHSVTQTWNLFTVSWQLCKETSKWDLWRRGNDTFQKNGVHHVISWR